jgi:EPS-associated MarR family transcriptional regulator
MPSRRSQLQEDTYFRVLRMLQDNPDLTQRDIAERLGVSTSGMNYCLNALIDKGWVKVQNFSQSKNKFGYVYLLTPSGIAEKAALTSVFLKRKMEEYEALKIEIAMLKSEIDTKNGEKPTEK